LESKKMSIETKKTGPDEQSGFIEEVKGKIRELQDKQGKSRVQFIHCYCQIGSNLNELRSRVEHGDWEDTVEDLGYHPTTAQRLTKLGDSWLPSQILTMQDKPELANRLPVDLQKLVAIIGKLTPEQFVDALRRHDFSQMGRGVVRKAVKVISKGGTYDESSEAEASTVSSEAKAQTGSTDASDASDDSSGPTTRVEHLTKLCEAIDLDLQNEVLKEVKDGAVDKETFHDLINAIEMAVDFLNDVHGKALESIAWKRPWQKKPEPRQLVDA